MTGAEWLRRVHEEELNAAERTGTKKPKGLPAPRRESPVEKGSSSGADLPRSTPIPSRKSGQP